MPHAGYYCFVLGRFLVCFKIHLIFFSSSSILNPRFFVPQFPVKYNNHLLQWVNLFYEENGIKFLLIPRAACFLKKITKIWLLRLSFFSLSSLQTYQYVDMTTIKTSPKVG